MKAIALYVHSPMSNNNVAVRTHFIDETTGAFVDILDATVVCGTDISTYTQADFRDAFETKILDYATGESYPVTAGDIVWLASVIDA